MLSETCAEKLRVHAVLVEQVDAVRPQSPQRRIGHLADVLRSAVDAVRRAVGVEAKPKLRRNHDPVAKWRQRLAEQLLVAKRPVGLGRVEERHPALERRVQQADRVRLVRRLAIGMAESHAAQAQRRHLETTLAEFALLHGRYCRTEPAEHDRA